MRYLILLGLFLGVACSKSGNSTKVETPIIQEASISAIIGQEDILLDLGSIPYGKNKDGLVSIKQNQIATLIPSALVNGKLVLDESSSPELSIISQSGCTSIKKSTGTCNIKVRANANGLSEGSLLQGSILLHNENDIETRINITAVVGEDTSIQSPALVSSTSSAIDFGSLSINDKPKDLIITYKAISLLQATDSHQVVVSSPFVIQSSSADRCSLKNISRGSSCTVKLRLDPSLVTSNGVVSGNISFAGLTIPLSATISGVVEEQSQIVWIYNGSEISLLDLGTLLSSNVPTKFNLYLKNNGNTNSDVINVDIAGDGFQVINRCIGKILLPNNQCSLEIRPNNSIGDKNIAISVSGKPNLSIPIKLVVSPDVITYLPEYSSYGTCSINESLACSGTGIKTRSLIGCKKFENGIFIENSDVSNCSEFDILENTQMQCESIAGEITIEIPNGEQIVSCPLGSNEHEIVSSSCDSGYSYNMGICKLSGPLYISNVKLEYGKSTINTSLIVEPIIGLLDVIENESPSVNASGTVVGVGAGYSGTGKGADVCVEGETCLAVINESKSSINLMTETFVSFDLPIGIGAPILCEFNGELCNVSSFGSSFGFSISNSNIQNPLNLLDLHFNGSIEDSIEIPYNQSSNSEYETFQITNGTSTFIDNRHLNGKVFNNELYFNMAYESNLRKLYKINENGIVVQVTNLNNGGDDNPALLLEYNNELYFRARNSLNRFDLYKISSGGNIVKLTNSQTTSIELSQLVEYNGELYFSMYTGANGGTKLHKVHPNGTITQVSNINGNGSNDDPYNLIVFDNQLYFIAQTSLGKKIFKVNSNGVVTKVSNTRLNGDDEPAYLTESHGFLYYSGRRYNGSGAPYSKLLRLSPAGVIEDVSNLNIYGGDMIGGNLINFQNELYFSTTNTQSQYNMYKVNAAGSITKMQDVPLGYSFSVVYDNSLYFLNSGNLFKLGTDGITRQVSAGMNISRVYGVYGNALYFLSSNNLHKINSNGEIRLISSNISSWSNSLLEYGDFLYLKSQDSQGIIQIFKIRK